MEETAKELLEAIEVFVDIKIAFAASPKQQTEWPSDRDVIRARLHLLGLLEGFVS